MRHLDSDDSLLQIAGALEVEAQGLVADAKHMTDDEKRIALPRASACYGSAECLRKVVQYRRAESSLR